MGEEPNDSGVPSDALRRIAEAVQSSPETVEKVRRAANAVLIPQPALPQVVEAIASVSSTRPEAAKASEILNTLDGQIRGIDRDEWPQDALTNTDFVLWVMATAIRDQATNEVGVGQGFKGATRLQKLCYFLREYVIDVGMFFSYDSYPYGVYSEEVLRSIRELSDNGMVRKLAKRVFVGDELLRREHTFYVTTRGLARYREIAKTLHQSVGKDRLELERTVVDVLYSKQARTLGLASKLHFTWVYWSPLQRLQTEQFLAFLKEGSTPDQREALAFFYDRLARFQSYLDLHQSPYDLASDEEALLRRCMVPGTFDPRRFFVIGNSGIATNYFVPVEVVQANPVIARQLALRLARLVHELAGTAPHSQESKPADGSSGSAIPLGVECLVVQFPGLASTLGSLIAESPPWKKKLRLIGPNCERGSDLIPQTAYDGCRGLRCVVLTDTIMTGDSTHRFVDFLSGTMGATILGVVAVADRGIGGRELIAISGKPVKVLYDKARLIRNLTIRFGHTILN
jgi:uncharacterized protein YwgA